MAKLLAALSRLRSDGDMSGSQQLTVYLHLARASERRARPMVRDRMLLLAGIHAAKQNYFRLSQYCRSKVLEHNPRHLVGRWPCIASAIQHEEFATFAQRLAARFPLERAEAMLNDLGIQFANEQDVYYHELEHAASILGIEPSLISDATEEC